MKNFSVLILAASMVAILPSVAAADYESSVSLPLDRVIDTSILNHDLYQVDPDVLNDGFMNNYRVSSDFGEFSISSTSLLKIRLTEIEAMAKMREVEAKQGIRLPLHPETGEISCATCHDPHEFKGGPVSQQPEHRLRADDVCQVCHDK